MRVLMVVLLALSAQAAESAPLRSGDFAYGMTLQGETGAAFYALELPEEVYRSVTRADLGDLRIFNAQGEVVPHLLQQPAAQVEVHQSLGLPFYPLFAETGQRAGETTLRIVPDEKGALIDLRSRSGEQAGKVISHYILDASALHEPLRMLRLQWQGGSETFVAPLVVEASDDLSHWRTVATGSLADLLYGGYQLQRNEIPLPAVSAKYLRINWPFGARQVALRAVEVEVAQPGSELPLHWTAAEAAASDGTVGRYRFVANGAYPVEKVEVVLPQPNSVVKARLASSADEATSQWRQHYQGVIYSLLQEKAPLDSGPLAIGRTTHRYWRLDIEQQNGGVGGGQPQLKLGWRPQRLIFVARGNAPFTLTFGSARVAVPPPDSSLQGVLDTLQKGRGDSSLAQPVSAQARHILGGEEQLRPAPPPLPWKTWLLWGVLLLGVVAMALMARSLYRQMNSGNGAQ